jgi:glycosyltransferase involved in cell wall biosynthesis
VPANERAGLVSVGNLKDAKGVDLLIEAYRRDVRLREHPLHLCGSGADEEKYKAQAAADNLPIVFHGRLTVPEVQAVVSKAKLLVNPSRMEGFSVALLESLACGTPIVGWAPQVRELAEWWNRPVGFPFDVRVQSADELAAVLLRALEDPVLEDRSRIELAGLARGSFSMERYGREMTAQYAELLGGG